VAIAVMAKPDKKGASTSDALAKSCWCNRYVVKLEKLTIIKMLGPPVDSVVLAS